MASIQTILEASERIKPYAHQTPVLTSTTLNDLSGRRLFFKCELFQRVGAFKFRGAINAVMKLTDDEASRGVVTHSSGNHAQALALAAKIRGIPAYVVMPNNAPEIKKKAVGGYGATITECVPTLAAREAAANEIIARTQARFIHPFDNDDIISGQGTATLELVRQVRDMGTELDCVIAPVGGGGMLSGTCLAAKAMNPGITIVAAEPAGADDCKRSFQEGRLVTITTTNTIADGLLTSMSDRTWRISQSFTPPLPPPLFP